MSSSIMLIAGGTMRGSEQFLREALKRTGAAQPTLLYIGAASGESRPFGMMMIATAKLAGAHRVEWPKLVGKKKDPEGMRKLLREVDAVFVGGGDVEAGMECLKAEGIDEAIREAHARGAVFAASSAGSIMLGERWIRWPHADAGDEHAETFPCLGIVPFSLDTHAEGDDWVETKAFVEVRARETGKAQTAYGIPSGGALLVAGKSAPHALGVPAMHFEAQPQGRARELATLKVAAHD